MRFPAMCAALFLVAFVAGRLLPVLGSRSASLSAPPADSRENLRNSATPPAPQPVLPATRSFEGERQSVREALAGDDPFLCAERMLAWLETTDAATFRTLAEHPDKFPYPTFSGFEGKFRSAFFEAIAERWLSFDADGALAAMVRIDAELDKHTNNGLVEAAAKSRPELILAKLPLENKGGYLEPHTRVALAALARKDAKAARRFAERWTNANLLKDACWAIARGIAENDPLSTVQLAKEKNDKQIYNVALQAAARTGSGMLRRVLREGAGDFGADAILPELVLEHPEIAAELPQMDRGKSIRYSVSEQALAAADDLSPDERRHLLATYDAMSATVRDSVVAAVASAWARAEPREAAEWSLAHGKADDPANAANNAAQQVFLRWINNDQDAALGWWRSIPQSPLRDALGTNASTYLAETGQIDGALELFRVPPDLPSHGSDSQRHRDEETLERSATAHLSQLLAERDPRLAAEWFATLPARVVTEHTANAVVASWYDRSPEEVARWIESLPSGMNRDAATRIFIERALQQSPAGAAAWVETIADPTLRTEAAQRLFWEMQREDPAAARSWVTTVAGIDEGWRARTLRRTK
jgi:hypothetical protein